MPRLAPSQNPDARQVALRWIEDSAHTDVVERALAHAQRSVWIATANLKDVRLEAPVGSVARAKGRYVSVTEHFASLMNRKVELRLLSASPPSGPFRTSLARRRSLADKAGWLRHCPRVHLKLLIVDGTDLYLGSANFTGAGLGAKADGRRNFELGITTSDHVLVDAAQRRFDRIWTGAECSGCRVRRQCPAPLDRR
ncbi:MAG TPA: phospholipase D family protein [Polyangiaceae bacterium]|nr:phospholipase D family protein [Polyangiaceae bacterium]